MKALPHGGERSNPFSTRFTRPGAMPFEFAEGQSRALLVERLQVSGGRAQIVGPHGSGKSTLVGELVESLQATGARCHVITLRDGQRRLPPGWRRAAEAADARWLVIDGYEQLSHVSRIVVRLACRQRRWGLLVTAHRDMGLPTLVCTQTNLELARSIVERLTTGHPQRLSTADVEQSFAAAGGNLRDMLFDLYDRWEAYERD